MDCPKCGYPTQGGFKGIYTPGAPCGGCGFKETNVDILAIDMAQRDLLAQRSHLDRAMGEAVRRTHGATASRVEPTMAEITAMFRDPSRARGDTAAGAIHGLRDLIGVPEAPTDNPLQKLAAEFRAAASSKTPLDLEAADFLGWAERIEGVINARGLEPPDPGNAFAGAAEAMRQQMGAGDRPEEPRAFMERIFAGVRAAQAPEPKQPWEGLREPTEDELMSRLNTLVDHMQGFSDEERAELRNFSALSREERAAKKPALIQMMARHLAEKGNAFAPVVGALGVAMGVAHEREKAWKGGHGSEAPVETVTMSQAHYDELTRKAASVLPENGKEDPLAAMAAIQKIAEPVDEDVRMARDLAMHDGFYAVLSDADRVRTFDTMLASVITKAPPPEDPSGMFQGYLVQVRAAFLARTPEEKSRIRAEQNIVTGEEMIRQSMEPLGPEPPPRTPEEETRDAAEMERIAAVMGPLFQTLTKKRSGASTGDGAASTSETDLGDLVGAIVGLRHMDASLPEDERQRRIDEVVARFPAELKDNRMMAVLRGRTREERHEIQSRLTRAEGEELVRRGKAVLDGTAPVEFAAALAPEEVLARALARRNALLGWLQKDHPSIVEEQRHTHPGTSERAYWHHGYLMALTDLLRALGKVDGAMVELAAPYERP